MKELDNENEVKGKFKFYDEEMEVLFPTDFSTFKNKLAEMLSVSNDSLKSFIIFYKDDKENKKEINNVEEYNDFIKYIQGKMEYITLEVVAREEGNINIKNSLKSILTFKNKKSNEINIINNNDNIINDNIEIIDNYINNNNNLIRDDRQQRNNNNNINNSQKQNNRQQQNNNINNYNNNNSNLAFPVKCQLCNIDPLFKIMFYCKDCNKIFCRQCEGEIGPIHPHSYYKVQNTSQYEYLNIGVPSNFQRMMGNVGNRMEQAYNSVLSFFGGSSDENQNQNNSNRNNINNINNISDINNVNNSQRGQQKYLQLIEMARSQYDLGNISDKKIIDALKQSNNNIDDAVILLISQN